MKRYSNNIRVFGLISMALTAFLFVFFFSSAFGLTEEGAETAVANQQGDDIDRLLEATNGSAKISINRSTGVASFVQFEPDSFIYDLSAASEETAVTQATLFLETYGGVFGISAVQDELVLAEVVSDYVGGRHVSYQQVYKATPVFAGVLKVHFDAQGDLYAINGTFVPDIKVNVTPTLSAEEASARAVAAVTRQQAGATSGNLAASSASVNFSAVESSLVIYNTGLLQGVSGATVLAYEVEVGNGASIREFIFVNAHSGEIVNQISGVHTDLDREVSETSLANIVWNESSGHPDPIPPGWASGSAQQVTDWNNEIDGAKETYNLFASAFEYDSYDDADATMRTVNNDPNISCPNANWNGTSTNYCSNVTGDDTVAHEWGHAYTEYTNNLIYQWQSGALNESYSDIWGEAVDFLNGRGTDAPGGLRTAGSCSIYGNGTPSTDNSYRWLSGEDDPAFGGAIRDLWNPTCYNDPGKVTDTQYWCSTEDSGGVHINSGVPNHAFALMVDGGTYNSQTITGLGLTKAAHIHWGAQNMLTPASNFVDHADALEASCTSLIGINLNALDTDSAVTTPSGEMISAADCQEVAKINTAVQLRTEPTQCNFGPLLDPNAPPLCEGLGSVEPILSEDWEGGALPAGWSVGTRDVANPPTFDTPDWAVVSTLPAGANGTYAAFVEDGPQYGNCADDTEAGVLYLESPAISIPAGSEVPRVAVDHWVATELGWDGGNVKVSVNGGGWQLIPSSKFDFNPYNSTINGGGNDNPMASEQAFTGTNGGSVGGSWGQSQITLTGIAAAGDSIKLRFEMGLDGCNGVIGWFVDDLQVYACSETAPGPPQINVDPNTLSASLPAGNHTTTRAFDITNSGESSLTWSIDEAEGSSVFGPEVITDQVERVGTTAVPDKIAAPERSPSQVIVDDGGFEAGPFGGTWTEFSANFGTPICDVGTCGTGTGTGPNSGNFWAWFGGINIYEEGSVSQSVTIPAGGEATLSFYLEQIACDSSADYMEVTLDGNQVFVTDGSSPLCGQLGYTLQTVDIGAYADGNAHTLEFHSEVFGDNGASSNFFVDDVGINEEVATGCSNPVDIPWLSVAPDSGTTAPMNSTEVTATFDATGLAEGTYTATLCVNSNDPASALTQIPVSVSVTAAGNWLIYLPIVSSP